MPRRALRQVMSVQDVYAYAEPIMQMLREEYGSYDADSLEEVQVEDPFVQRLQARGYEVRVPVDAPAPAMPTDGSSATRAVAPRRRAATPTASTATAPVASTTPSAPTAVPPTSSAAPAADAPRPATRTRRTSTGATSGDEGATPTRRTAGTTARAATTRRTTRTAPTGSDGEGE